MPWAIPIYYFDIWIWGETIHISCKITEGRQSSLPLEVYVKGITRAFNWLKCLDGIMHLKLTAGCQISTLIFEKKMWRGISINIPWKIYQGRQSSCPLGIYDKGIARVFNWRKCLGFIMHLKPTAGCQISTLIFEKQIVEGVSINIPWKIYQGRKVLAHFGFRLKVLPGSLTDLSA
jgi:hypothetical protein